MISADPAATCVQPVQPSHKTENDTQRCGYPVWSWGTAFVEVEEHLARRGYTTRFTCPG
eukprot:m.349102 g.349102  ORF g.349102 m.349102 type:complete len:59 (-) comp16567_c0_seq1:1180-1356(-)